MNKNYWTRQNRRMCLAACALTFLVAGCATAPQPDLVRMYAHQSGMVEQPPVVVIHGLMGGRLTDEHGNEVWPGPWRKVLFSDYANLRLPIDPETLEPVDDGRVVSGITDKAAGRDFYGRITEVLESAGRYRKAEVGTAAQAGEKRYYHFAYDWRQDNVLTARKLNEFIDQIRSDYGDPDLEVDIVAHSMGGLVVRYFVRYGTVDTLDDNDFPVSNAGASKVRRVILLGTPNLGSALSFHGFIKGVKIGLGTMPTETAATFPSTYQLFPHALADLLVTVDGHSLPHDLFDVEFWQQFQFSVFDPEVEARVIGRFENPDEGRAYLETLQAYFGKRLERARRFVWSLTVPVPEPDVKYIVFGGDCHLTPTRVLVEEEDGEPVVRLRPKDVRNRIPGVDYEALMLEPGDGTVSKASVLARQVLDPTVRRHRYIDFPLDHAFFLCEKHSALTANIHFHDNLLHALLSLD